jgi:general stress protein 26
MDPTTELHAQFSSPGATSTPWAEAREALERAEIFWLASVRPDGRPHVTPLLAGWLDGELYFSTGEGERKARNLARNAHCVLTTGCNALHEGLDLVVEGDAAPVRDEATLRRLAARYAEKYGWRFEVRDGALHGDGGRALVYAVAPTQVFGYGRGASFSATRWRFADAPETEVTSCAG